MSKRLGPLPRYWCNGDRNQHMVGSCVTFSGTRVDQYVAVEVLEALRPLGIQAALDALDHSQNQTDEKRRALELAVQKARYEAERFERQYNAAEPENRLVAAELEKRWNNSLTHVEEMQRRLEDANNAAPPPITPEQRDGVI
jgi:chromosome segregation ATPase